MGRPKEPLIERSEVIAKALEMIDRDGIEALSIRKLGLELGVNGASLYHHFRDKDEILDGVRRLVLEKLRVPESKDVAWQDFCLAAAVAFRDALARHPNAAPLMIWRADRPVGRGVRDFIAGAVQRAGVPAKYVFPIIDSLESLAFGVAMMNPEGLRPYDRLGQPDERHPHLSAAVKANRASVDATFRQQVAALIEGWTARIARDQAERTARKRTV